MGYRPSGRRRPRQAAGFWVFTRYDEVVAIGRDARHFSSDQARGGVVGLIDVPMDPNWDGGQLLLTMDPPSHTRHRRLVNRGFPPRMIGVLESHP